MNTRISSRARPYCLVPAVTFFLAMASGPSMAAGFGGALQPGSTVCTDYLQTDGGGVYLRGYAGGIGTYVWTMRMSKSPGGPETEIFRVATREVLQHVIPPQTGRAWFRNCLSVTDRTATFYRLGVGPGPRGLNPVYGVGAHIATLAPGSSACGEFAMAPVFFRGSASADIRWSVRGTDFDYSPVGEIFSSSGATVDQLIDLPSWIFSVDACATNNSSVFATVSFDFVNP
jgi:hypothetical protein